MLIKALSHSFTYSIELVLMTAEFILWLFIALCVFLYIADPACYKEYIVKEIERSIGFPMQVKGPIKLTLMPFPQAKLHEVSFSFLKAKELYVKIEILYEEKAIRIKSFEANKVETQGIIIDKVKANTTFLTKGLQMDEFYLKRGKNEFKGDLLFKSVGKITKISGKLNTPSWEVVPHISDVTFNEIEANIDFIVPKLMLGKHLIQNSIIKVHADKNKMIFSPKGTYVGGALQAEVTYHSVGKSPMMSFDVNLKNARADEFLEMFGAKNKLRGGSVDFTFRGTTRGSSFEEWKRQLSGRALVNAKNMTLVDKRFRGSGLDIFSTLFGVFFGQKTSNRLECAVLKLNFANGVAKSQQSIGLATGDSFVLGSGQTNLSTSGVNYLFNVYSRHPVNLEIVSMDHVVRVTGSLDNPQVRLSSEGFVKGGISVFLGIATGGMSLLAEKLLKLGVQRGSPCQMVLEQAD